MYRVSYDSVARSLFFGIQFGSRRQWLSMLVGHHHAPLFVRGNTTGDDHAYSASGPLGIERGHAFKPVRLLLKACMHRPHNAPVTQLCVSQVQR